MFFACGVAFRPSLLYLHCVLKLTPLLSKVISHKIFHSANELEQYSPDEKFIIIAIKYDHRIPKDLIL